MNEQLTIADVVHHANTSQHKATARALYPRDAETFADLVRSGSKYVRVYSSDGFVPNSYKWRCKIEYAQLCNGVISIGWTGAQRSHGAGSLVVARG